MKTDSSNIKEERFEKNNKINEQNIDEGHRMPRSPFLSSFQFRPSHLRPTMTCTCISLLKKEVPFGPLLPRGALLFGTDSSEDSFTTFLTSSSPRSAVIRSTYRHNPQFLCP